MVVFHVSTFILHLQTAGGYDFLLLPFQKIPDGVHPHIHNVLSYDFKEHGDSALFSFTFQRPKVSLRKSFL